MSQQEIYISPSSETSNDVIHTLEDIHTVAGVVEVDKAKTLIHPLSEAPKPRSKKRRRRLPAW